MTSLGFLVALRCSDAFGLGSSARGAVLAGFGVAGMVSGRPSGRLVDRLGRISVTVAGAFICAVLVATHRRRGERRPPWRCCGSPRARPRR